MKTFIVLGYKQKGDLEWKRALVFSAPTSEAALQAAYASPFSRDVTYLSVEGPPGVRHKGPPGLVGWIESGSIAKP
jgi:hypothetical protein